MCWMQLFFLNFWAAQMLDPICFSVFFCIFGKKVNSEALIFLTFPIIFEKPWTSSMISLVGCLEKMPNYLKKPMSHLPFCEAMAGDRFSRLSWIFCTSANPQMQEMGFVVVCGFLGTEHFVLNIFFKTR